MEPCTWLWFDSGFGDAGWNMALDEALLENTSRFAGPVLRVYAWTQPAASFGYFQKYAAVETATPLRPLVRRPTAGGIVPHNADWTYSLAFPPHHEWYALSAIESYRRVHTWIQSAFSQLSVPTVLAPQASKSELGQCFVGYEQFDLIWQGRKIAGAAQRRRRDGLLIQGSIQPPPVGLNRKDWEMAMRRSGPPGEPVNWVAFNADPPLLARANELLLLKYNQSSYHRKR